MFQRRVLQEINTHFMFNNFSRKWCNANMEKYGRARQATDDNIMRRRKGVICMPDY
jgi:hypothetical protein